MTINYHLVEFLYSIQTSYLIQFAAWKTIDAGNFWEAAGSTQIV
jgi:hypothetical protein